MSLGEARSPTGGAKSQRVIEECPLNPVSMQYVVSRENMLQAWKQVRANEGAPGVDEITVREFLSYAKAHWEGIKASLLNGTYRPHPVKRVEIPKDSGGTRKLGIPIVMDRVIQQAITQVLTPVSVSRKTGACLYSHTVDSDSLSG